jgi:TNF receptor-associated protein 1
MRFVRGVIDSEDLPLNISRESMQDSSLVRKLGEVVAKRLLKFLDREATENPEAWKSYYAKFSRFFKEGVATDHANREAVAKLLRFESSMSGEGELVSLEAYRSRMKEDQKAIYYQVAPARSMIEQGPYVGAFKARGYEVLYLFDTIDDYVVSSLREFDGKPLVAVNSEQADLGEEPAAEGEALSAEAASGLCGWLKEKLGDEVTEVRVSKRLTESPALALTPDGEMTAQFRQMLRAMNKNGEIPPTKVILEINPRHAVIRRLAEEREAPEGSGKAELIATQMLDNALLSAGLLEDTHRVVARTERMMAALLGVG